MIKRYVKLPIPVEAIQFEYTYDGILALQQFCGESLGNVCKDTIGEAEIGTLEDGEFLKVKHIATEGDYIVKGPNGEFWPVRKLIFESTYEEFKE